MARSMLALLEGGSPLGDTSIIEFGLVTVSRMQNPCQLYRRMRIQGVKSPHGCCIDHRIDPHKL